MRYYYVSKFVIIIWSNKIWNDDNFNTINIFLSHDDDDDDDDEEEGGGGNQNDNDYSNSNNTIYHICYQIILMFVILVTLYV